MSRQCGDIQISSKTSVWKAIYHELMHHFPYAVMAVALALMVLSVINVFFYSGIGESLSGGIPHAHDCCHGAAAEISHASGMDVLFHSFHFIHILFATSGAMVTFYRYSRKIWQGLLLGLFSSLVFCTFSDVLLPYAAGLMLGVHMHLHICFHSELPNILPFLICGLINGLVMVQIDEFRSEKNSLNLHFVHTFISAMASIFYAVGHGLSDFYSQFGLFFALMVVAVIVPCTLSDVVAPILFARMVEKK